MAEQFTTTEAEMRAFSARIDAVNGQVQAEIARLQAVVDTITSGWRGAAAGAYQALQAEVNQDATRLNDILRGIKDAIDVTTTNYARSDEEQRADLAGLASQGSVFG
ncbi:WXG100 family type VII secretion target [Kitasatospora sp. NPDC052896]|uniref:WXG100 family type VII secretion target n=1 Tax=Kitasatospora sp. NPDC052896 TaxID=3364061 RepID=UPI0037C551E0